MPGKKNIETFTHDEASRKNIPTAEYHSVMKKDEQSPVRIAYERRNRDLDPQLVWRGKDEQDRTDLVVHAPPLYIQEKIQSKALIDDLKRQTEASQAEAERQDPGFMSEMFDDFNGLPNEAAKTEFYQHEAHWSNRMILGDSLQVMASLAEREGLRGKVQCIYLDPPYGIRFNSNFQWSTTSRDVKDGKAEHITREPEQVKAFRDTWRDGIHSYLSYLRDRLTVARDLLTESGSIFMQIGDENVHRVRSVLDEVLGPDNFVVQIGFQKTGGLAGKYLESTQDYILWYGKNKDNLKFRQLFLDRQEGHTSLDRYDQHESELFNEEPVAKAITDVNLIRRYQLAPLYSDGELATGSQPIYFQGNEYKTRQGTHWKTRPEGNVRLCKSNRIRKMGTTIRYKRYVGDFSVLPVTERWDSMQLGVQRTYIVQTANEVVKRCLLMSTDPGDLVIDPTCGSGTTAYVAEQWGRRWITIDTSRVSLALARARIMGARYPYYLLKDSKAGQQKEAEITRTAPSTHAVAGNIRLGFVYERVPHITLKSIANNKEIDEIWGQFQAKLEPMREQLNKALGESWQEWQIPRAANDAWPVKAGELHAAWWQQRIARQKEIDASIAAKAEFEYLYDRPYEDNKKVRVAGPFTVESLSPHRVLGVDENDELIDGITEFQDDYGREQDFTRMILENLKTAGVQQAHKEDKIDFTSVTPWPGNLVCAEGVYYEVSESAADSGGTRKRAAIFVGPEFGTVSRPDLVAAVREAGDADFDVLISCAFNYDAQSSAFDKVGRINVLKARMNADLHMAEELKNTGKGNLFVIFGEPDIDIINSEDGLVRVKLNGVDVFHPNTGEVRSDGADGIACWFIDTDYNEESFFVRHAYFLGANDPYKALKTTLKAEINQDAWATLNSDTSRPFTKPASGRIAVKVINHLGDEVMKVFRVD